MTRIYLASASPRRLELLRQVGIEPAVVTSRFQEDTFLFGDPARTAREYALGKALGALPLPDIGLCIGADTVVHLQGRVLAKPEGAEHACEMLRQLSGQVHEVITGIALVRGQNHYAVSHECTLVEFRPLTEEEIQNYVSTGEPMDKAGGYGIQGRGAVFVSRIIGCYSNVVGLPLTRLYSMLAEWDINLTTGWR